MKMKVVNCYGKQAGIKIVFNFRYLNRACNNYDIKCQIRRLLVSSVHKSTSNLQLGNYTTKPIKTKCLSSTYYINL